MVSLPVPGYLFKSQRTMTPPAFLMISLPVSSVVFLIPSFFIACLLAIAIPTRTIPIHPPTNASMNVNEANPNSMIVPFSLVWSSIESFPEQKPQQRPSAIRGHAHDLLGFLALLLLMFLLELPELAVFLRV